MQNQVALNNKECNVEKTLWMYFVECITQKYFCFDGRARRKEFFGYLFFRFLIVFGIVFVLSLMGLSESVVSILTSILAFLFLIPDFSVFVRRIHDVGFSAWWISIPYVALFFAVSAPFLIGYAFPGLVYVVISVFALVPIIVVFVKSDLEKNQYGPVPDGLLK